MDQIGFRCPPYLAQRFWLLCNERGDTPGTLLRSFMIAEIKAVDPDFAADLEAATGHDEAEIREGTAPNVPGVGRRRQA